MSGNMVFQAALLRAGKQGIIRPDPAGYYTQCIGGLDIENAGGIIYASDKAKRLFEQSSSLQRRIANRALRGEMGHPRRTAEFLSEQAWMARLNDILESNTGVYWSEIGLDFSYGKDNPYLNRPNMIGIMARYRPGGVGAPVLERDLADPEANVCFSLRAFSTPRTQFGKRFYDIQNIVTWDYVTEPGIAQAAKTMSATMESLVDEPVSTRVIRELAMQQTSVPDNDPHYLMVSNESRGNIMELAGMIEVDSGIPRGTSIYHRWK